MNPVNATIPPPTAPSPEPLKGPFGEITMSPPPDMQEVDKNTVALEFPVAARVGVGTRYGSAGGYDFWLSVSSQDEKGRTIGMSNFVVTLTQGMTIDVAAYFEHPYPQPGKYTLAVSLSVRMPDGNTLDLAKNSAAYRLEAK